MHHLTAHYILLQAEVMLVKNAQNLMKAVIKTVQAAEAACMKVHPHTHHTHTHTPTHIAARYALTVCSSPPRDSAHLTVMKRRRWRLLLWRWVGRESCIISVPWRHSMLLVMLEA